MNASLLTVAQFNKELQADTLDIKDLDNSFFVLPSKHMPADKIELPQADAHYIKDLSVRCHQDGNPEKQQQFIRETINQYRR